MSEIPSHLRYSDTHEWVCMESDGIVRVGVTDHAQQLLGDIVFVELPEAGSDVRAGTECAVVESVKAAADIYSPLNGKVVDINKQLADAPDLVNTSPYGEGWLFSMKLNDVNDFDKLLDADAYSSEVESD